MNKIFAIFISVFMAGCVSIQNSPVSENTISNMANKSIIISSRTNQDFLAATAGRSAFGALGQMEMISAGNEILSQYDIADPAGYIANELAVHLASDFKMLYIDNEMVSVNAKTTSGVSKVPFGSDYLLDIHTTAWGFTYFATDWNNYRVYYNAKLRLIDAATKEASAEGFCSWTPKKTPNAPSYDELLGQGASRLQQEIKRAADFCVSQFKEKIF
mgnify:CR=1 FL=1